MMTGEMTTMMMTMTKNDRRENDNNHVDNDDNDDGDNRGSHLVTVVGSLSNHDGDGYEDVT